MHKPSEAAHLTMSAPPGLSILTQAILALQSAFQKYVHLPEDTHCLALYIRAVEAPNTLFQPTPLTLPGNLQVPA